MAPTPSVEAPSGKARERILSTAYELFSRRGLKSVGVDTIIARSSVAKMTFYRHFPSKDQLVLAFLEQREQRWTRAWLESEVRDRATKPDKQLLAIFDVFDEWFQRDDFEGCAFINTLLEVPDPASPVREASVRHLATIRSIVRGMASDAGIARAGDFARKWHILMKGSIVAAGEGDKRAAKRAREVGALLLAAAPRR